VESRDGEARGGGSLADPMGGRRGRRRRSGKVGEEEETVLILWKEEEGRGGGVEISGSDQETHSHALEAVQRRMAWGVRGGRRHMSPALQAATSEMAIRPFWGWPSAGCRRVGHSGP
jgi:hypothetical protein